MSFGFATLSLHSLWLEPITASFGPVAVFLIEIIGARSEIAIAVLSAVGTGIGTLFMLVILYWLAMIIWAYSDKEARTSVGPNVEDKNEVIVSAIHKL